MNCIACNGLTKKFGKDRKGFQRYRCLSCKKAFVEPRDKMLGEMILDDDKALSVLHHLVEGCSIRTVSRLTDTHPKTVLKLLSFAGEKCERLMAERIQGVSVKDVQCDEIWGFIGMKEKTKSKAGITDSTLGDAYTYVGIERHSKLVLAWHLGRRTNADTIAFTEKLARATADHRFQITTDGFKPYEHAIVLSLGTKRVDFAMLVKIFAGPNVEDQRKYSPAECIDSQVVPIYGTPDYERVCTSHVERANLTMRMQMRRLTRLTNAFSKKWNKLHDMLALYFAWYNFCRVHSSIRMTPAMEAGVTDHIWSLRDLLAP
jgi:transposase-like protein/IS1 family transposase